MGLKDLVNDIQKSQADCAHLLLRNGNCVGSDIGWSVSIPVKELTVVYRQAERRRQHRFWILRGDSHWLFLQDGSSKDYA